MHTLLQDVRYAIRVPRQSPGCIVVAVVSLGLGIGANRAIFSLIDAALFRPLPVDRPTATDPMTFVTTPFVLTPVAIGATYIPARRGTRVDPLVALRYE